MKAKRQFKLPAKGSTFAYPPAEPAYYHMLRRLLAAICLPVILVGGIATLIFAGPDGQSSITIMSFMAFASCFTVVAIGFCQG